MSRQVEENIFCQSKSKKKLNVFHYNPGMALGVPVG
jgi:hypothetical protein